MLRHCRCKSSRRPPDGLTWADLRQSAISRVIGSPEPSSRIRRFGEVYAAIGDTAERLGRAGRRELRRAVVCSTVGNVIEAYDFLSTP